MSLLGRLEDLSLTDIIQIVFLSRRTGILEIIEGDSRRSVYFSHGLIVSVSSPDDPDLETYLCGRGTITPEQLQAAREIEDVVIGDFAVVEGIVSPDELAELIESRIVSVVTALLDAREGEFNFILSDKLDRRDIGYDADSLFSKGGIEPQKILGDGEKVKPLQGLEDSMKVGRALLRGSGMQPTVSPRLDLGLGAGSIESTSEPELVSLWAGGELPTGESQPSASERVDTPEEMTVVEAATEKTEEPPFPEDAPGEISAGKASETESKDVLETGSEGEKTLVQELEPRPEKRASAPTASRLRIVQELATGDPGAHQEDHNVVILERDPLVRVAAKRAFATRTTTVLQFGTIEDTRQSLQDLLERNRFFVTFLSLSADTAETAETIRLMQHIKRKNRHLPVAIVDLEPDMRRRHNLIEAGANIYLTKPSRSHMQPGLADQSLALFADELTLFAEGAFYDWEELTSTMGQGGEIGRKFYYIAEKERLNRSLALVRQLINELSDPDDINQVSETVLRMAEDYLDRAALFVVTHRTFYGLGGFGSDGRGSSINQTVHRLRVNREDDSIFREVSERCEGHRGKIRRTKINVEVIETLGTMQPTEVVVLPIVNEDRIVGLLYGDNAEQRTPIDELGGLEVFLSQAAFAFENAVIARLRKKGFD